MEGNVIKKNIKIILVIIIAVILLLIIKFIWNIYANKTRQSELEKLKNRENIENALFVYKNEKSEDKILEKCYEKAEEKLSKMSLEEKVSQLFLVRCPETNAKNIVEKYQPGGYILFAKDFKEKTKEQVIAMIQEFQNNSKIPMIIGVDEEGR